MSDSFWPHELQYARLPCPSLSPRVYSNSCSLNRWCHPIISSSVTLFLSCPQSFPAWESLLMIQLFESHSQTIGASASALVLPKSIQGWFPLRLTSLISLLSNRLSRAFSSTKFQSINSSVVCLLHCPALISVHDYWKDPCLGYMDLCWKRDAFVFSHTI